MCIFVYIVVYLCIFLYIRTYLQNMRRTICDKSSYQINISLQYTQPSLQCSQPSHQYPQPSEQKKKWLGGWAWLFIIFFDFHQLSKIFKTFLNFSKIFTCSKTSKIDISCLLDFLLTPRTNQELICLRIFKNFKIDKNRIFD